MTQAGVSLDVQNLRKSWGKTDVLMGVNFNIEPGGFLTLLGPSGCGKSTALRLISGLDEVSDGKILIEGNDVTQRPADQRNIGMVFQNYALFPHMTVGENIAYGLKVRRVAKAARIASVARVAELMALGPLLDRKPAQLSGGQQQRVALARVLVSERPLVLMDEPLSNLDAKLRVEIRSEIRALNKKLGITIVYVTHDQSEALSMSDTVVLMNEGRAEQIGTPKQLYDAPATIFAARFIGTPPMNLLPASDVTVHDEMRADADMSDLLIGVRPESLTFPEQTMELAANCNVTSVEYEGSVFLVHLMSPSGSPFILSYAGADVPEQGDAITVGWTRAATHLFSKTTGQRIPSAP
ncbi:putative glycerol-3-phosphate ABC transporter ATP-binding protein [Octadecabacter antarcticus 307]|uniref:Putative glycerol-3-phosphate ABC transporter ATP-binding protein n=1 Tax=Octadecabacter antarcticus 307 TaxID=391626 RepID=M9R2N9_9RHOB|nr:ABC transporter ATP-binding protein [Octadecabacter antarcticus]AGI66487.1 putative glycerol-3-phosphate ABC transporter ATP-binding protein [Octadecabacter antarcticus 307]